MPKVIINKKKFNFSVLIKIFVIILLLISFISIYLHLKNERPTKFVSNILESFSHNLNYIFIDLEIKVLNKSRIITIEKYFEQYFNHSIFLIPIKELEKKIKMEPWVKSVSISTNFKNKISINILEKKPIGVYYNGHSNLLIDEFGEVIDFIDSEKIDQYINFIGKDSLNNISFLLKEIPESIKKDTKKAEYIGQRRWDLITSENIRIKLPETNINETLQKYIEIYDASLNQSDRKINFVDLRIPNRIIINFNK